MKVGVIGSRGLTVNNLGKYLPEDTTEIVSGGAKGIDTCARDYALTHDSAPLKRNLQIIEYADVVIAFWDGKSKGTKYVIDNCKKQGVQVDVHIFS